MDSDDKNEGDGLKTAPELCEILVGAQVTKSLAADLIEVAALTGLKRSEVIRRSLQYTLPRYRSGELSVVNVNLPTVEAANGRAS